MADVEVRVACGVGSERVCGNCEYSRGQANGISFAVQLCEPKQLMQAVCLLIDVSWPPAVIGRALSGVHVIRFTDIKLHDISCARGY